MSEVNSASLFWWQVEDSWKNCDYPVLPHRDSKDVFILGGTDDIQVLLDDSMVGDCQKVCRNSLEGE